MDGCRPNGRVGDIHPRRPGGDPKFSVRMEFPREAPPNVNERWAIHNLAKPTLGRDGGRPPDPCLAWSPPTRLFDIMTLAPWR